jgi:SAM-dependent methyltransferase
VNASAALDSFEYAVDPARLDAPLRETFSSSSRDAEFDEFLRRAEVERAGKFRTFAFRSLQFLWSDYDAYAALRMYGMHLLGSRQWRALLARTADARRGSLLDVGAGDGGVTGFARPLFERIVVTESSRGLTRLLRRQGFEHVDHDLGAAPWPSDERFDVVSVLNVIDRTRRPRSLLAHARDALKPRGTLLVSVPLPLLPHVHVGSRTLPPDEALPEPRDTFEEGVNSLANELLTPLGLRVERWTRLPYASHGDTKHAFYVLDAVVLALARA